MLNAIADHHRRRHADGWARPVTYAALSDSTGAVPVDIGRAIGRLVALGLIAVQPGSGSRPNAYFMAMPIARTAATAEPDDPAPSF